MRRDGRVKAVVANVKCAKFINILPSLGVEVCPAREDARIALAHCSTRWYSRREAREYQVAVILLDPETQDLLGDRLLSAQIQYGLDDPGLNGAPPGDSVLAGADIAPGDGLRKAGGERARGRVLLHCVDQRRMRAAVVRGDPRSGALLADRFYCLTHRAVTA